MKTGIWKIKYQGQKIDQQYRNRASGYRSHSCKKQLNPAKLELMPKEICTVCCLSNSSSFSH